MFGCLCLEHSAYGDIYIVNLKFPIIYNILMCFERLGGCNDLVMQRAIINGCIYIIENVNILIRIIGNFRCEFESTVREL